VNGIASYTCPFMSFCCYFRPLCSFVCVEQLRVKKRPAAPSGYNDSGLVEQKTKTKKFLTNNMA